MVATLDRPTTDLHTASADPSPPRKGKDGTMVRVWIVDGAPVEFSLEPIPVAERNVYWYPKPGALMWWRAQEKTAHGNQPIIQKEVWLDGKFSPRNAWEEHMTREWLRHPSRHMDPDKIKGDNHPEGPGHVFRCGTCKWPCGNWHAFKLHQLPSTGHTGMTTEKI
jgi:hypothetical protein